MKRRIFIFMALILLFIPIVYAGAPTTDTPIFNVTSSNFYKTMGIRAQGTYNHSTGNHTGTLRFRWFLDGIEYFSNNITSLYTGDIRLSTFPTASLYSGAVVNTTLYAFDDTDSLSSAEYWNALTVLSNPPQHNPPILNSSDGLNTSKTNITVFNVSTVDTDNDPVQNIIQWYRNGGDFQLINLPFNSNSSNSTDSMDYSSKRFNFKVIGNATFNKKGGIVGKGDYYFDGSGDCVNITYNLSPSLNPNGSISVFAWIKKTANVDSMDIVKIASNGQPTDRYPLRLLTRNASNNKVQCIGYNATGDIFSAIGNVDLQLNQWYFVGCTYDGYTLTTFFNGIAVKNATGLNIMMDHSKINVGCGARTTAGVAINPFTGSIDKVTIWNESLSDEQVKYMYNQDVANKSYYSITTSMLKHNQVWEAEIYPNDGVVDGINKISNLLTINDAPTIFTAYINTTYNSNNSDENIVATVYRYSDNYGGSLTYYYDWYKNNVLIMSGTNNTLASYNLSAGDSYYVNITMYNGIQNSSKYMTNIIIPNYMNVTTLYPENNSSMNLLDMIINYNLTFSEALTCDMYANVTEDYDFFGEQINPPIQYGNNSINASDMIESYIFPYYTRCRSPAGINYFSEKRYFTVDRTMPVLHTYNPNEQNTTYINTQTTTFNATCTDYSGLYAFELNITNLSGNTVYYYLNNTLNNITSYNYLQLINFSRNLSASYNYLYRCSDRHTASAIGKYETDVSVESKQLEYVDDGVSTLISLSDSDLNLSYITTNKITDRYKFDFAFEDVVEATPDLIEVPIGDSKEGTGADLKIPDEEDLEKIKPVKEEPVIEPLYSHYYVYKVESNQKITYVNNSEYQGHFVIGNGIGNNWLDFEGVDGNVTVTQFPTYYEVRIDTDETNLTFESIGGLNIINLTGTFDYGYTVVNFSPSSPRNKTFVSGTVILNATLFSVTNRADNISIFIDGLEYKHCAGSVNCTLRWNTSSFSEGLHYFNATGVSNNTDTNFSKTYVVSTANTYTVNDTVMSTIFAYESDFVYDDATPTMAFEEKYRHNATVYFIDNSVENLTSIIYSFPISRLTYDFASRKDMYDTAYVDGSSTDVTFSVNANNVTITINKSMTQGYHDVVFDYSIITSVPQMNGGGGGGVSQTALPSSAINLSFWIKNESLTFDQIKLKGADITSKYNYNMFIFGLYDEYRLNSDINGEIFLFNGNVSTTPYKLDVFVLDNKNFTMQSINITGKIDNYYLFSRKLEVPVGNYNVLVIADIHGTTVYEFIPIKVVKSKFDFFTWILEKAESIDIELYALWFGWILLLLLLLYFVYKLATKQS